MEQASGYREGLFRFGDGGPVMEGITDGTTIAHQRDGLVFHGACTVAEILDRWGFVSVHDERTSLEANGFERVTGSYDDDLGGETCARCGERFPDPDSL